jgi:hypothetical protein
VVVENLGYRKFQIVNQSILAKPKKKFPLTFHIQTILNNEYNPKHRKNPVWSHPVVSGDHVFPAFQSARRTDRAGKILS